MSMSEAALAALAVDFPQGLPSWTAPFAKAVDTMAELEEKDAERKRLLPTNVAQKVALDSSLDALEVLDGKEEERRAEREKMEEAEANLREAIAESAGAHPVPYIWLTVLLMQEEQWNKAREAAAKAVELDRLSTSSLFRLSSCYEAERNYESAFASFSRAVGLLPSFEQAPHRAKLAQLKDQAADQKAKVFRGDPFDILPLEIIIQIMRIGLDSNKNFVLQKSWVCRNWRSILCTRCPELWSYLSFHQWDIKDGKAAEKRQTWMRRSGNRITGLNIRQLSLTGVGTLPKWYTANLEAVKTFDLTLKGPDVVVRLKKTHGWHFENLEHLTIGGGYAIHGRYRGINGHVDNLHCGLAGSTNLKTLKLSHMAFCDPDYPRTLSPDDSSLRQYVTAYPNLRRLTIDFCPISNSYYSAFCTEAENGTKYQADPLHKMLRGADNLQHLDVMPYSKELWDSRPKPGMGKRIAMPNLKYARIPPPMMWCVDISAPSLETLVYAIPAGPAFAAAEVELLPKFAHGPVLGDSVSRLKTVELLLGPLDTVSRLEEWLSQMDNVTTLVLRNTASFPGQVTVSSMQSTSSNKASMAATQLLADRPQLCPQLHDLRLENGFTNGKSLVDFVRARKRLGCAPIRRLHGNLNTMLSDKANAALHAEVSYCRFTNNRNAPIAQTQNDDFDVDASPAQA